MPSIIIGMTGPSGSGKTTAAAYLSSCGWISINCDQITHKILLKNQECIQILSKIFGKYIVENGQINRKYLAQKAFASQENIQKLNQITHPFIIKEILKEIVNFEQIGYSHIVLDAPTLFESGVNQFCDYTLVVLAKPEIRLRRIMQRDQLDYESAKTRINAQKEDSFYWEQSNFQIDGNIEETMIIELDKIYQKILALGEGHRRKR